VICDARSLFVCVVISENSDPIKYRSRSSTSYSSSYPPRLTQDQLPGCQILPDMPDSSSESRPLISPSAQSQPRPLTTTADKRKQDKSVIKSSLDIVFSCEPHGRSLGRRFIKRIKLITAALITPPSAVDSRSQQLFFGSHLPSAPSFVASSTGDGDTSHGDSHYYFNPHIDPGSARKRRTRAQAERRRRRRAVEGGEDVEAGGEEYNDDDEEEDDFGSTVDDGDIAEEDESVVDTPDQEYREDQTFERQRGRRDSKDPRDPSGKYKRRFQPRLLDRDSNDHDIFAADHSPSPSRPTSPHRTPAGLEAGQGYGTVDATPGKGKNTVKQAMRRWDSERTITSGNAFDQSTKDYRGWTGPAPSESDEIKESEVSLNEESETEEDLPRADVQPLRKASAISLRLPTEFSRGIPGRGLTPLSPGSNAQEPSSSTPLAKPRRASNLSALSTPVRRDARQGSFASYNRGIRRGSMTLALSPGAQEQAVLQARKMSVGVKDIKGRQVEVGRSTSGQTVCGPNVAVDREACC
jgi:hypothetical protein